MSYRTKISAILCALLLIFLFGYGYSAYSSYIPNSENRLLFSDANSAEDFPNIVGVYFNPDAIEIGGKANIIIEMGDESDIKEIKLFAFNPSGQKSEYKVEKAWANLWLYEFRDSDLAGNYVIEIQATNLQDETTSKFAVLQVYDSNVGANSEAKYLNLNVVPAEDIPEGEIKQSYSNDANISGSGIINIQNKYYWNNCCSAASASIGSRWYYTYLDSSSDVDWHKFSNSSSRTLRFRLDVPSNKDYDLAIYTGCTWFGWCWGESNYIGSCTRGSGQDEDCSFYVPSGSVYVKVYGYNGSYSTSTPYYINVSVPDPCAGVSCSDYCSGDTRVWNGSCSGGTCNYGSYTNCNNMDSTGSYEYYCSGSERRKHQWNINYGCGSGNCNLLSQGWINDQSVENCTYGCNTSTGSCNAPSCSAGWKCNANNQGQNYRGYQYSNCTWSNVSYCSNGCDSGYCITCNNAGNCGSNGLVGSNYCSSNDVYRDYRTWGCGNPGTKDSWCYYSNSAEKQQECYDTTYENYGGNYCSGDSIVKSRTVHNKGCSSGSCYANDSTETSLVSNCNEQDYYSSVEYYCSGNQKRQRQRFYDYTCGSAACYQASSNYVNDSLVENCTYACSGGACITGCIGNINANAKDKYTNAAMQGAKVYVDEVYKGVTGSNGKLAVQTIDSTCLRSHSIKVYNASDQYCGSSNAFIWYSGQPINAYFSCPTPSLQQLSMAISTQPTYYLNATGNIAINVKDSYGSAINGASVNVYNPISKTKTNYTTDSSGVVNYSFSASTTGYYNFQFKATKTNYLSATKSAGLNIKSYGEIVVDVVTTNGEYAKDATVYLDDAYKGVTSSEGKLRLGNVVEGAHIVKVCGGNYCKTKSATISYQTAISNVKFICDECAGSVLNVSVRMAVNGCDSYPIQNTYVNIDGVEKGLTDCLGNLTIKNIPYGQRTVELLMKSSETEGTLQKIKTINVDEPNETVKFSIAQSDLSGLSIASGDSVHSTEVFTIAAIITAILIILEIGADTWDVYDASSCALDTAKLSERNYCALEGAMVGWDIVAFDAGGVSWGRRILGWLGRGSDAAKLALKHGDEAVDIGKIGNEGWKASRIKRADGIVDIATQADNATFIRMVRIPPNTIKKIIQKYWDELTTKIDDLFKKTKLSDMPATVVKDPSNPSKYSSNIKGFLGERTTDEYIEILKKGFGVEGRNVIKVQGKAGEKFAETANYIFKHGDDNGRVIIKKIGGKEREIDRLIFVDDKPIIFETDIGPFRNIGDRLEEAGGASKYYDEVVTPVRELYQQANPEFFEKLSDIERNPAFRLIGPNEGEILAEKGIKDFIDGLGTKGVADAGADILPQTLKQFEDATANIIRGQ